MKTSDKPLLIVVTPFPALRTATLTQNTWSVHIQPNRPQLARRLEWLRQTLSAPTAVCAGTSDKNNFAFVNADLIYGTASPLVVFVNREGLVETPGFRRDFASLNAKTVLWTPP